MVAWAAIIVVNSFYAQPSLFAIHLAELARNAALLWFVFGVAGDSLPRWFRLTSYLVASVLLIVLLATGLGLAVDGALLLARSGLAFAFVGLASLEQIFRNARGEARAMLRYLVLGLGILFAYDLFLYSQVELLDGIGIKRMGRARSNRRVGSAVDCRRRSPQPGLVNRHLRFASGGFLLDDVSCRRRLLALGLVWRLFTCVSLAARGVGWGRFCFSPARWWCLGSFCFRNRCGAA